MSNKTILRVESPKTQAIDSVKALLSWRGRASDPLPSYVELGEGESRLVLVLSNKKDCYYTTTARDCSCPARSWHPNQPCKHQRKYFAEQSHNPARQTMAETLAQAEANLPKMPYRYRQMVKAAREAAESEPSDVIPHKPFKPFIEDEERSPAKAPSIPLVDTMGDPTARDLAYWSIQEDKALWPAEA